MAMTETPLPLDFYRRHSADVAKDLLGKRLVVGAHQGIITETEAYRGTDDPASHAWRGPTPRTQIMFGRAGVAYVYMIYGMYYCLNVVTEDDGQAGAVLIRGLVLPDIHLDGPGKLCRHLRLTTAHNGLDMTMGADVYVTTGVKVPAYESTPRIGVRPAGADKLWRFIAPDLGV